MGGGWRADEVDGDLFFEDEEDGRGIASFRAPLKYPESFGFVSNSYQVSAVLQDDCNSYQTDKTFHFLKRGNQG